jgi:glycosyltransferase involved in cell wall biosynthesis
MRTRGTAQGPENERQRGISVVICCHNSAQRLPPTLAHLAAQQVREGLVWEVVVVDNASTDDTARVAREAWPADSPVPFRVIHEPQPGLSHARRRGFDETHFDLISFIDDDNWCGPDWVQIAADLMEAHPEVGACGGYLEEVCEVEPPAWFERFKTAYAVGPQAEKAGVLERTWDCLAGAGMTIRRAAWEQLLENGFQPLLSGRKGSALTSGEDIEFMYVLRLAGWSLWYEPRLQIRHFIPAGRLQWSYLRRMRRGGGASTVSLDPYSFALLGEARALKERLRRTWSWQMARTLKNLLQCRRELIFSARGSGEGDPYVLEVEHYTGRLVELMRCRGVYGQQIRELQNSCWTRAPRSGALLSISCYDGVAKPIGSV